MQKRPVALALAVASALVLSACGGGSGDGDGGGATGGSGGGGESYQWDFTVTTGNTSTWYEGAEEFARIVDEESDGRMQVNIVTNEQLSGGDPAAGVEQLMNGEKAFSLNSTIIYAGLDERFGVVNAPFLFSNLDQVDAKRDAITEVYTELGAEKGVHVLGMGESGFRQITNAVRPIRTPEDLEGIKMRIPGIGLFTDAYRDMGANPTTMNWSEVFTALQQGTIEGQENPLDIISTSALEEVQDHLTIWNYVYDPLIFGMSQDMWEELSAEDQAIVEDAAAQAIELQISNNREKEAGQLEDLKGKMEVIELSPEEMVVFQEALQPLYDKYTDIWGQDLLDAVRPES